MSDTSNTTLSLFNSGEGIVKYLTGKSDKCDAFGTEIVFGKELGRGEFGVVSEVAIPKPGAYVIKKFRRFEPQIMGSKGTLKDNIASLKGLVNEAVASSLNGGDLNAVVDGVRIPKSMLPCRKKDRFTYECEIDSYVEYIISLLVSDLLCKGKCINFIEMVDFISCQKSGSLDQYTIMEKIDGTLHDGPVTVADIDAALIQILSAVAIYQDAYKLSHNDLHSNNVMIKLITDDMSWNGQRLADAKYFHYSIRGTDIYFPATRFIVKIGDWGLGVKFSKPIIRSSEDHWWLSRDYMPQYDSMFVLFYVSKMRALSNLPSVMLRQLIGDVDITTLTMPNSGYRPVPRAIERYTHGTAENMLKMMPAYKIKPDDGGMIITLGVL